MTEYKRHNHTKKILVWVSSLTGNTKSIACVLIEELQAMGYEPVIAASSPNLRKELTGTYQIKDDYSDEQDSRDHSGQLISIECDKDSAQEKQAEPDIPVILCFWCRRAGMDDQTLHFLHGLSGRKILAFGTMGSYPDSDYGRQVYDSVAQCVGEKNHLEGIYLCRGRIDERRTIKRRVLPKDHRHYLNDEGYARHLSSRSHPDDKDKEGAVRFLKDRLKSFEQADPV